LKKDPAVLPREDADRERGREIKVRLACEGKEKGGEKKKSRGEVKGTI